MSKKDKVLVTSAGPNMMRVLTEFSLPRFQRFGAEQGYDIHVEELSKDSLTRKSEDAKSARWQKMRILRAALKQYDTVAWFDADVLIRRYDEDIARHLADTSFQGLVLHDVPAEDRINPNTGVWVIRNRQESFDFLNAVEDIGMPQGRWADQGAVMRALDWINGDENYRGARMPTAKNRFVQGTTWLPIGWNQPYCEDRPNPEAYVGRPTVADPHALHFMAMTIDERVAAMASAT